MKTLPKVATAVYEVDLPIHGKKIKIRPFLAQEEKILLMAMEGGEEDDIKNALKQIISNCIVTKDIDIGKLANLDVEKIFIELRRRSVSETVNITFDLREVFECGADACPEKYKVAIKLDSIEVKNLDKKKKIIMLNDTVGVSLRHPTMETGNLSEAASTSKTQALFEFIANIIDEVFDGDEVTKADEFGQETLIEWVSTSFQHKQLEEAIDFLSNQPYLYKSFEIKCETCGKVKTQEATGLIDFFI